jgi:hypothetical protein
MHYEVTENSIIIIIIIIIIQWTNTEITFTIYSQPSVCTEKQMTESYLKCIKQKWNFVMYASNNVQFQVYC